MSTEETERSSAGDTSNQERTHVDPATDRKQSQSYSHKAALAVAVIGGLVVASTGGVTNGLFVLGWCLAIGGIAVAILTGQEVGDE